MDTAVLPPAGPLRSALLGQAACNSADPDLFRPVATAGASYELQVEQAKAICCACRVRESCLLSGIQAHASGIWGGTTDAERARVVRALGRYA